ncbi:molecular chaperone HtpG [Caenispirillum bisanense]|uniref:Chaperone protein HtpG n=1 Tax=Caenispirillum bisanense TaxID=414052 RepID=A0A286GGT2_9PROT|nr:molecular chaperone HtpG [Caenispirillum bisanense]SOD94710.1 molecular chaperone HtpG [Caenispirillum bisanense]
MAEEKLQFQAEVARVLDIVVHSLYSHKEIFLRELVSNASDACDKLRWMALTQPELTADDPGFRITLIPNKDAKTLTVADNGVGMNRDELIENLGTIARSGTGEFLRQLTGDSRKDVSLIGQFGVGFYSAFMVAQSVEVVTRRAGDAHGWRWTSDGTGSFTVAEAADAARGTRVVLHLKDEEHEFLEPFRLRHIVKTYSDHIAIPVQLKDGDAEPETLNEASALWTRSKDEITAEQYKEFYHHVAHTFDEPWLTLHTKAEGAIEYTSLLFVPTQKPFDLFQPDRKQHLRLYVNRVFITDDCEGLLPAWLRFVRGVVDSPDLPLNVSREMLQHNPLLKKIQNGLVNKLLGELKKKAADAPEDYARFWDVFGPVVKEGMYEDFERRDKITELVRFRTTHGEDLVSFEDYVGRMKEGQTHIYYITGDDRAAIAQSPLLEGYRAKGVEVLLLTDPIDEFWVANAPGYKDFGMKSVAAGGTDLAAIKGAEDDKAAEERKKDEAPREDLDSLVTLLKATLGTKVKDVRPSDRLTESPVCLVADEGDMPMHLERLLRAHKQKDDETPRVLEINPAHALIKHMAARATAGASPDLEDMAYLLLDQARIVEGEAPTDPVAFGKRLAKVMAKGIAA